MTELILFLISNILKGRSYQDVLFDLVGYPAELRTDSSWIYVMEIMDSRLQHNHIEPLFWLLLEYQRANSTPTLDNLFENYPNNLSSQNQKRWRLIKEILAFLERTIPDSYRNDKAQLELDVIHARNRNEVTYTKPDVYLTVWNNMDVVLFDQCVKIIREGFYYNEQRVAKALRDSTVPLTSCITN